ncbi:ATP synthase subunit I [Desnuesiella massiliensis]|uniref:ATP synthase subunit I n=1 Tax=Desnuesiella massiliensis TaxID=1650662 RepID=UPI0006E15E6E|nr:ATP synthase subunit I [Desnuesiella massiliensis]
MGNNLKYMLKQVTVFTLIIAIIFGVIGFWILKTSYVISFLIGAVISIFNLLLNSIITDFSLGYVKKATPILIVLSYIVRVILISFIGILVTINEKYNLVFYLAGFISYFAALIIYGLNLSRKEGK